MVVLRLMKVHPLNPMTEPTPALAFVAFGPKPGMASCHYLGFVIGLGTEICLDRPRHPGLRFGLAAFKAYFQSCQGFPIFLGLAICLHQ